MNKCLGLFLGPCFIAVAGAATLDWPGRQAQGHSARYWLAALHSYDPKLRSHAAHALGEIGAECSAAAPELARILREDPEYLPRVEAALALTKLGPAARAAVPALAQALEDEEPGVRMNSALALFLLRGEARQAVPALLAAAGEDRNRMEMPAFHSTIRQMMLVALGRASAGSADAVPTLLEA